MWEDQRKRGVLFRHMDLTMSWEHTLQRAGGSLGLQLRRLLCAVGLDLRIVTIQIIQKP
jgi:hypothetical protein